jgi:hypothetical protein
MAPAHRRLMAHTDPAAAAAAASLKPSNQLNRTVQITHHIQLQLLPSPSTTLHMYMFPTTSPAPMYVTWTYACQMLHLLLMMFCSWYMWVYWVGKIPLPPKATHSCLPTAAAEPLHKPPTTCAAQVQSYQPQPLRPYAAAVVDAVLQLRIHGSCGDKSTPHQPSTAAVRPIHSPSNHLHWQCAVPLPHPWVATSTHQPPLRA